MPMHQVPGGVLLHAGHDLQLRDAGARRLHRHGGPGRAAAVGQDLHGRAHGHLGVGAHRRRRLRPRAGGQRKAHLEGHAVPRRHDFQVRAQDSLHGNNAMS